MGDHSGAPLILLVLVEDSLSVMLSAPLDSISAGHLLFVPSDLLSIVPTQLSAPGG